MYGPKTVECEELCNYPQECNEYIHDLANILSVFAPYRNRPTAAPACNSSTITPILFIICVYVCVYIYIYARFLVQMQPLLFGNRAEGTKWFWLPKSLRERGLSLVVGKKIAWGGVGWTGRKKDKRMQKKRSGTDHSGGALATSQPPPNLSLQYMCWDAAATKRACPLLS